MFWLLPSTIEILLVSVVSTGLTEVIQELAVVTVLRDYAEARIFRRKKSPKLSSNEISLKYLVKGEILPKLKYHCYSCANAVFSDTRHGAQKAIEQKQLIASCLIIFVIFLPWYQSTAGQSSL